MTYANETSFDNATIDGGSKTVYSANGSPVNLSVRWGKLDPATTGGVPTWQAFYRVDSSASPSATTVRWQQFGAAATGGNAIVAGVNTAIGAAPGNFTFSTSGADLTVPTLMTLTNINVDGVDAGPIKFDYSANLTQFSGSTTSGSAAGQVGGISITANGYTAGSFQSLSLDSGGRLVGNYSNGQIVPVAQVSEAHFKNSDGLTRVSGGTFQQTLDSGQPVVLSAGSELTGGSVEQSNTDIAAEFTKMIVTQQAYSANAKVITTANNILQDILQVIR